MAMDIAHLKLEEDIYDLVDSGSVIDVAYDTTNKKLTQTKASGTTDIVALSTLKTDMSLNNVENKSSATIRSELTSSNVTTALGYTPYNATNPDGYTSNIGTVTGVTVNGSTKSPTNGVVNIGTVITDVSHLAPKASPEFTGTPKAPTAANGTNNTQIATTAFVMNAFTYNDAMIYKGVVNSNNDLPATHKQGWTYKVGTAGTYVGKTCEVGDMILCNTDGTSASDSHWDIVQTNIDGAVTGPASATDAHVAVFDGTTGKIIKDSGYTIGKSVPSNAVFTDTKVTSSANHYSPSTSSGSEVSASASGGTAAWSIDVVQGVTLNTDGKGHVTGISVTSGKIPANPDTNTHRPINVNGTQALGNNTTALNLIAGDNVTITDGGSGSVTIAATDTTYSSKSAASGGTDISLVTTGEKYTWNNKSDLALGTTATTAAKGNHTHGLSLAADSGSSSISLSANTKYKLTAGGSTYVFTTPEDTTYSSKTAASGGTDVSLVTTGEKYTWNNKSDLALGTTATTAAKGNHTHGLSLAADSGSSSITLAASSKYKLTAGGSTYVFTTPPNTTYESKSASSGGTDVSLVTTGEKYNWNQNVSCTTENVQTALGVEAGATTTLFYRKDGTWQTPSGAGIGTVTSVATGTGLTGGPITSTGTISLDTSGVTAGNYGPSANVTGSDGATMNVPYITVDTYGRVTSISNKTYTSKNTTYSSKAASSGGTDVSLVTTGEKYTWNSKAGTSVATTTADGLMSSTDKTKLNGIAEGATANVGTITGITMNGSSKGTSGVVDLGTVITAHQDISGKADKRATVSTVSYDTSNKKITKTINGTTSDVVSASTLKTDMSLNNVENKSSATIRSEITSSNVTTALGYTPKQSGTFTWGDLYTATS